MALDDLPVAIRGAVTQVALFVLPGAGNLTVWLDDLRAANPQMVVDADTALVAALDGGISIGGTPVPAILVVPGVAAPAAPFIGIVHYAMTPADILGGQPQRSADHTVAGAPDLSCARSLAPAVPHRLYGRQRRQPGDDRRFRFDDAGHAGRA